VFLDNTFFYRSTVVKRTSTDESPSPNDPLKTFARNAGIAFS